jgi:hypothetical protein
MLFYWILHLQCSDFVQPKAFLPIIAYNSCYLVSSPMKGSLPPRNGNVIRAATWQETTAKQLPFLCLGQIELLETSGQTPQPYSPSKPWSQMHSKLLQLQVGLLTSNTGVTWELENCKELDPSPAHWLRIWASHSQACSSLRSTTPRLFLSKMVLALWRPRKLSPKGPRCQGNFKSGWQSTYLAVPWPTLPSPLTCQRQCWSRMVKNVQGFLLPLKCVFIRKKIYF